MIDELVKTVRLHLSERLTSPLMGAFTVSWCLWNYRMILVLLSEEPVLKKFEIVQQVVYPTWEHTVGPGITFPLATCLAYIFLYPHPAKAVYAYTRKRQREILEIRRQIEEETPLTIEDSRRIRAELARARQEFLSELDKKDAEIELLRGQQKDEGEPITIPPESAVVSSGEQENPESRLPDNLQTMLEQLAAVAGNGRVHSSDLIESSGLDPVEGRYVLGELHDKGLVDAEWDTDAGEPVYFFKQEGRKALIMGRQRRR